jgi:hypothetical protein
VLDLYEELTRIIAALDERHVEYALCGGLAMAVWGYPRATVDITPEIEDVWTSRTRLEWERGSIAVVSRAGLVKLKSYRASGTDLDDIHRLREIE